MPSSGVSIKLVVKRYFQRLHPASLVIFSYLLAAFIGMILLSLPVASTTEPLHPVDALFTSTSAICVTGLIVVDTGSQFTAFGKTVILVLIQLGGLGVMTFSVFLFLFLGRGLGLKERWIITESFTPTPIGEIKNLMKSIFVFTFLVEGIGTVLLFLHWRNEMPAGSALFTSLFHSISAFCNAGFSFFSDSFIRYRSSPLLNFTVMFLIVIGGIGFPVIYESIVKLRLRRRHVRTSFSLHTKVVVATTIILILAGAAMIYFLERRNVMLSLTPGEKALASFFQSITARTAGFNTLDISSLGGATLFILIVLMFVGASPGSCGGGIKTTSLAILFGILINRVRGREFVSLYRRTVSNETISRALAIFILAVITVTTGLIFLLATQTGPEEPGRATFLAYLFETVSAFGTVGLSMGVTSYLSFAGKVVIIMLMLLGRVGLLTIAYVFTRRVREGLFRYSEEKVMIG